MKNQNLMPDKPTYNVTGKIILHAQFTTASPLLVGKGEGESSDMEIMRMPDGTAYIPASSFAGVLRSRFAQWEVDCDKKTGDCITQAARMFWGTRQQKNVIAGNAGNNPPSNPTEQEYQSHIIFDDLITLGATTTQLRDAVKIFPHTGTAENKYDFEVLEPYVTFHMRAEVTIRNNQFKTDFEKYVQTIADILHDENFRLGAQTNNGFGKIKCNCCKAWQFNFKKDGEAWFHYLRSLPLAINAAYWNAEPPQELLMPLILSKPPRLQKDFKITATFKIKSALITGAYSIEPNAPDKTHFTRNNGGNKEPVLTGKAIKGALRHRALKIMNTLYPDGSKAGEIEKMMGFVKEQTANDGSGNGTQQNRQQPLAQRGNLRVEEHVIMNAKPMEQTRIKIDRFTGGTIGGALFQSEPLWGQDNTTVTIEMTLGNDFKNDHALLLMHMLKDLWTEDLAIGGEKNVGRGVLTGKKATIKYDQMEMIIEATDDKENPISIIGGELKNQIETWETQLLKMKAIKL